MKNLIVQAQRLDASGDEQVRQWFKRRCRRAVYSCSVLLVRALTDTISYVYKRYRSSFSPLLLVLKVHRRGIQLSCNPSGLFCFFRFFVFFFFKLPFPGELSQQKTKQLYQMARQCLERSESLSDSLRATHGAEAAQKQHVPVTPPVPAPRRLVASTGDPRGSLSSSTVQASIAQPLAATQHSVPLAAVQRQPHVTKQVSQPR